MRKLMMAAATGLAMTGLAGIGHNLPPAATPQTHHQDRAVLPRRIADENRRNQKLKQKLRRGTRWGGKFHRDTRFMRKAMRFGPGYRPGKLFKGHRI